jgi:hypothetical protein
MRHRRPSTTALATGLVLSAGLLAAAAPGAPFRAALIPNGLDYGGRADYQVTLDRGLTPGGSRRLRAALGGTLIRVASEPAGDAKSAARLLGEWRTRLYGQFEGAMSYPGMVTRRYDVPEALRPREIRPPRGGRAEWIVPATSRLTFGAGADDLVRYVAVVADLYCPAPGRAVELALFYPRESFREKEALAEEAAFACLRSPR